MAKIRNINGTSDADCKCGSWLDHWKNFGGRAITLCAVKGCSNKDLVGAHVQKADINDNKWYIIPLCREHNNKRGAELEIFDDYAFVSANKKETCEK